MKKLLTTFILLTCGISYGQNLVPNGDFEQYWNCPTDFGDIDSSKFWLTPTNGTPDYYNQCATIPSHMNVPNAYFGFQQAHSGGAFVGIYVFINAPIDYHEYIQVPLVSPLTANACYQFKMYISLANSSQYNCFNIGAYFSSTIISVMSNDSTLPFNPQINNTVSNLPDTLSWTLVSANYTALGGESYLTIGNFDNNSITDTITVNPLGVASYIYIDDVSLTLCPDNGITNYNKGIQINLFPNPVTENFTINIDNSEPTDIIIYDLSSRKLLQQTFTNSTTLNTEQLAKGMYLYTVRNRNGIIKNGKVIKE